MICQDYIIFLNMFTRIIFYTLLIRKCNHYGLIDEMKEIGYNLI